MIIRIAFIFVMLFYPCSLTGEELKGVAQSWPLYISETESGPSGRDWKVVKHVLNEMGYELMVDFLPWKRCLSQIRSRKADLIISVGRTDKRAVEMFFSTEILSVCDWAFFFRKGTRFRYRDLSSIEDMTVGTILGYHYGYEFNTDDRITRSAVPSIEQNFKKLINKRVDLVIEERRVGRKVIYDLGLQDKIDWTDKPIATSSPLYVAFSKKEGYKELAKAFSLRLKEFKKTEQYLNIDNN